MSHRSNRRRPRRRGRFSGLYKVLSTLLILGILAAACLIFFRVNKVVVSGNQRYTAEEIIQVAGVEYGENLYSLNKGDIDRQLREQLPYVEAVSIWRALPDTLMIEVRECRAAACIQAEGGLWLLNTSGKLLEQVEESEVTQILGVTPLQPAAGTLLAVSQEESHKLSDLAALMTALEQAGLLSETNSIDLSSNTVMEARWQDRLTVRFSYASDYEYDARALQAAIDYLGEQEQSVVDLTFEDGPHLYQEPQAG